MMKTSVLILYSLYIIAVAVAAPKDTKPHFRNLYKQPTGEIKTKFNPRIIGGQEAVPHSIPYQVFLEVNDPNKAWYCGGSLISENYVLTSAGCVNQVQQVTVTLGAHTPLQTEDTQVTVVSTDIIVHDDYNAQRFLNDVALIKLPNSVELTDSIQTVRLPSQADANKNYVGVTATISGWGSVNGGPYNYSNVLNFVDVEVISNADCSVAFGQLTNSNICTSGEQSTGACTGDTGGPLVYDGTQIGIESFVYVYCLPGYPTGYSKVSSFIPWIAKNSDVQII